MDGVVTKYLYDNEDIIAEYDANGNIITKYIHGLGIDEPLSMEKNGQQYYYHTDGLGSVTEITNSSGTVVQSYQYDSFGNIKSVLDPNFIQPYTFTGREYDSETGLLYLRERTLDTKTGTFISKDPIGFAGGINLYAYVSNNPVNFVDPFGLHEVHFLPLYKTFKPTYDRMVVTYDDNGIPANISSGSINPDPKQDNCKKGCPTIESGSYTFKHGRFPNDPNQPKKRPALEIGTVPTTGPNPNNKNLSSATGVWIHDGCNSRTCAEGCLTVNLRDWKGFMKNFSKGSTGRVTVFDE